jgi:hypothetical protein
MIDVANFKSNSIPNNWLDKLIGSISDESAFLQALEYGRSFRQADKPVDESDLITRSLLPCVEAQHTNGLKQSNKL